MKLIYWLILFLGIISILIILWLVKKRTKTKKKKPSWYICLDGHKVRSQGELIIDNALYLMNISHEYEDFINKTKSNFKYDWYIPHSELYIEYFGYWTDSYKKRTKEKIKFYTKNRLQLLAIEPDDIANIYLFLEINLKKHGIHTQKIRNIGSDLTSKFCHNCGANLDARF